MHPTTLRAFARAIFSSWFTTMSGGLSVPAAALAVFGPNAWVQISFAITAFICVWAAAYTAWAKERAARNESDNTRIALEARLSPKISVSITNNGVLEIPLGDATTSKWIQIIVRSLTDASLRDCEVWVNDIVRLHEDGTEFSVFDEAARCTWSQRYNNDSVRFTIPSGISQRANLFKIFPTTSQGYPVVYPLPTLDFVKIILNDEMKKPGR